jgi:pimeloyl-ACP methyl ester carboxylesterase
MTPMQLNDENWKLGLYQGKYTRQDMERGAGKDFYTLYKEFSIGAIPKLAKIPGFLLKKPLMKRLSACDEGVLRSLGTDMKVEDYRESVEKITVPVCYFYAVPGSLYSPALAQWYSEHVRTAYRAVPFQKSTHMLITDHPDEFAQELIKVIEGRAFS